MGLAILGIETNPKISETLHFQGKFTTETQRARSFRWGYPRTHSQAVRASRGSSRLQYIHPQAISKREKTRTTAPTNLLLPCRSWCSLCLRGEIFFLREPRRTLFDGRAVCSMRSLSVISIALCMIRRIFLFGFWRPENVFSAGKQRVLRPAGLEIAEANFFIQLTNGETCAF